MDDVVVTVCMITYNHKNYIARAIESVIEQETAFRFLLVISDDCSTDGTREICKEYAEKYKSKIKLVLPDANMGSMRNFCATLSLCHSKYVAICDGDDYWTDKNKLQLQVDYLDAHPDCSICFHPVALIYDAQPGKSKTFPDKAYAPFVYQKGRASFTDLLRKNFIQTSSVMYRWAFGCDREISDEVPVDISPGDWYLHLIHARDGYIGFVNREMSIYRVNSSSMWYRASYYDSNFFTKNAIPHLLFFKAVQKRFETSNNKEFNKQIRAFTYQCIIALLSNRKYELLQLLHSDFSDYFENALNYIGETMIASSKKTKEGFLNKIKRKIKRLSEIIH